MGLCHTCHNNTTLWGPCHGSLKAFSMKKLFGYFPPVLELLRLSAIIAIFTDENLRLTDVIFLAQVHLPGKKDKALNLSGLLITSQNLSLLLPGNKMWSMSRDLTL